MKKRQLSRLFTIGIFLVYTVLTLIPFYFLFIRSFIPTTEINKPHFWIPPVKEFNMKTRYGNVAVFYNLNLDHFREAMQIPRTVYINPNLTFEKLSQKYNIPEEWIKNYMNPFIRYNGWLVVLYDSRFLRSLVATALITVTSILVGGFLGIATGSTLARFERKYHLYIYNLYLIQVVIPPVMIMLPLYLIIKKLGLYNSYATMILLHIKGGALPIMLFTSYFSTIPKELKESVYIDGGERLSYFFYIILPLSGVPFASYIAITIPWVWNDFLNGFLFLTDEKYTFIPLINSLQGTYSTNFQAIYAALCISIIPLLLLYICFQKLFIQSQMAGAIKG